MPLEGETESSGRHWTRSNCSLFIRSRYTLNNKRRARVSKNAPAFVFSLHHFTINDKTRSQTKQPRNLETVKSDDGKPTSMRLFFLPQRRQHTITTTTMSCFQAQVFRPSIFCYSTGTEKEKGQALTIPATSPPASAAQGIFAEPEPEDPPFVGPRTTVVVTSARAATRTEEEGDEAL